jgi:hypothetical protein
MRPSTSRVLLAIAFSAGSVLAATGLAQKPDTEAWTEASGNSAASHTDLVTTAPYYGLELLTLYQYGHTPCVVGMGESAFATHSMERPEPIKACEPNGGEIWKQVDVGAGNYVTAIATCKSYTKDDAAIHGIEVWSAAVGPDGKLKPTSTSTKLEFAECKKWEPKRLCPAGTVATGVRAFTADNEHGIEGLALRCHEIAPR